MWPVLSFVQSDCRIFCSPRSLERIMWCVSFFCMEFIIKCRYHLRLLLLVECGQLCHLPSQIAGFFDHQYLWKESVDILVSLHGVSHKGKVAPITCHLFGLGVVSCGHLIILQDCLISNISGENQLVSLFFLHGDNYQEKVRSIITVLGCVWAGVPLAQWDRRILWSSISLEGIGWYQSDHCLLLVFLHLYQT